MIEYLLLTPCGSILDSQGDKPIIFVAPHAIGALREDITGLGPTSLWIGGNDPIRVQETIVQIERQRLAMMLQFREEQCLSCGCTEGNACQAQDTGEPCSWADAEHTICSACAAGKERS